jgi:putative membrane protein
MQAMTETLTAFALGAVTPLADQWHDGHWGRWFILIPLFWIAVLFAVFWLFRRSGGTGRGGEAALSATEVLERRFAEGQIDEEEYRRRRATLDADRKR